MNLVEGVSVSWRSDDNRVNDFIRWQRDEHARDRMELEREQQERDGIHAAAVRQMKDAEILRRKW
jgi:hypothetical protein